MNEIIDHDYLEHHGILGQKWYDRNGPPYPLNPAKDYSAKEKKLNKYSNNSQNKSAKKSLNEFKKRYKIKDNRKAFNDLRLIFNLVDRTGYIKLSNSLNEKNKSLYKEYTESINKIRKQLEDDKTYDERHERGLLSSEEFNNLKRELTKLEYAKAKLANIELGYEANKDIQKYIIEAASNYQD